MDEKTHLDLFSGIGGFSLAAQACGIKTVQFVEFDPRCRAFLAKAWPGVPIWDDVRTFLLADSGQGELPQPQASREDRAGDDAARTGGAYLLTAGVPCQPASRAGKQRGAADDRWLWPDAIRVLSHVRPTWALFENPPGIGDVGLAGILSDVEAQGYQVRVFDIPACAVGAPHRRARFYIVARRNADPDEAGHEGTDVRAQGDAAEDGLRSERGEGVADSAELRWEAGWPSVSGEAQGGEPRPETPRLPVSAWSNSALLPCADGKFRRAPDDSFNLVDGLHRSVLGALGNSIVPQVAVEVIRAMIVVDEEILVDKPETEFYAAW